MLQVPAALRSTRLVLTDVDGVLNDGTLLYGPDGEILKQFNVRDGLGISLLQHVGIRVGIVTGRSSMALEKRAADLGVTELRTGVIDKAEACLAAMVRLGVAPETVVFVGDDLVDLSAFAVCGCAVAVADAHPAVTSRADVVLELGGGRGAFRELADAILLAQGHVDLVTGQRPVALSQFELSRGNAKLETSGTSFGKV